MTDLRNAPKLRAALRALGRRGEATCVELAADLSTATHPVSRDSATQLLTRLRDRGLVEGCGTEPTATRPRIIYRPTAAGSAEAARLEAQRWRATATRPAKRPRLGLGALILCLLLSPPRARADLVETSTRAGVATTRIHLPASVCRNPVGPCAERAILDATLLLGRLQICRVDLAAAKGSAAAEAQTRAKMPAPVPYAVRAPEGWAGGWIWAALGVGIVSGVALSWVARQ